MNARVSAPRDVHDLVLAGSGFPTDDDEAAEVRFDWTPDGAARAEVLWVACDADARDATRMIAPRGNRLWRRAPWPAADALFDLAPPPERRALVLGSRAAGELEDMLEERGLRPRRATRIAAGDLEASAVVVLVDEPGEALPAEVPAVLAAGRVLVTTPREPAFGFRPGIDHCEGRSPEVLANLAESALRHWDAFASMRTNARVAAARHRASRVVRDLVVDLELGL